MAYLRWLFLITQSGEISVGFTIPCWAKSDLTSLGQTGG